MNQDIERFIQQNKGTIHNNSEEAYEFLKEGETCVLLENPHNSQDMELIITPEQLTLSFDAWSRTFANSEDGIHDLLEEAAGILDVRSYIWKACIDGEEMISLVRDEPGVFYDLCQKGFEAEINGRHVAIYPGQIRQSFVFWDPMMMHPLQSPWLM